MDLLKATNCKNCGAPFEHNPVCEYCHTIYFQVSSDIPVSWAYDPRYIKHEDMARLTEPNWIMAIYVPDGININDVLIPIPVGSTIQQMDSPHNATTTTETW